LSHAHFVVVVVVAFQMSPWDSGLVQNQTAAVHMAKDLVKSVSFFDVLDDMKTMALLGKEDRNTTLSTDSSPHRPTLQERLFGRKRTQRTKKQPVSSQEEVLDFQSRVNADGEILFDGRTDEDIENELSKELF
jgi:hypothetical protein